MSTYLIERPDWQLFTQAGTLSQKAGVPVSQLRRLVLKELVDNALDAGAAASIDDIDADTWEVVDDGAGFDPKDLERLFSVDRPLASSKLWRMPTRGAMGNGLRVVSGAVIASGGSLEISTRGGRYRVHPLATGGCDVEHLGDASTDNTVIRIRFGAGLPADDQAWIWGQAAVYMAGGATYTGKPSAWHHDVDSIVTLLRGSEKMYVRDFVSRFDGCTGGRAGEIASPWLAQRCGQLNRDDARQLLHRMRDASPQVSARRLGAVGACYHLGEHYVKVDSIVHFGAAADEDAASAAFVVECWATRATGFKSTVQICVNNTPSPVECSVFRRDKRMAITGANLSFFVDLAPKTGEWHFFINVITPYMPIVSDGKSPDLRPFHPAILDAIGKAARKAKGVRSMTGEKLSQVDILRENIDQIVAQASNDGRFRPSVRDLFYKARPFYLDAGMEPPAYNYFASMITDYENDIGEIEGLYREERGSITHPHGRGAIPLGTQDVEAYERPSWLYGAIVVIEKGGLVEAVTAAGLHNRYDAAFMTSRGFTTRACKDLLDNLDEHDEPLKVFSVSDADAHGGLIFQSLVEETAARGARKIEIVNLGLFPWEAKEMGLVAETFTPSKAARPVADFVREYDSAHGAEWIEWLQSNRYELNAMGLPEFISWLEDKLQQHGVEKVAPPKEVLESAFEKSLEATVREALTEKILLEADLEQQVKDAIAALSAAADAVDNDELQEWLAENPRDQWRGYIIEKVDEQVEDL